MKKLIIVSSFLSITILFFSCGGKKTNNSPGDEYKDLKDDKRVVDRKVDSSSVTGYYVGIFKNTNTGPDRNWETEDNIITISIDSLNGESIYGHSVVAGNLVPFVGKVKIEPVTRMGNYYKVAKVVNEGNSKYDDSLGVYNFGVDFVKKSISGTWIKPFAKKGEAEFKFILSKSEYTDDTSSIKGYYDGNIWHEDGNSNVSKTENISMVLEKPENDNRLKGRIYRRGSQPTFEFRSTYQKSQVRYEVTNYFVTDAKETGDNKYNGTFNFEIDLIKNCIVGTWVANDKNLEVTNCSFQLSKTAFDYNPDWSVEDLAYSSPGDYQSRYSDKNHEEESEYITEAAAKFNASKVLLKEDDVKNMYKADLEVMRNAIYARHGYSFQNRRMRYVFTRLPWYMPVSVDVRNDLTEIEKANEELIKRYEEYAETYYDYFGR